MGRREIGLVSSTLLLPATAFLAVTGLVSDALDLNEFVFHKYTGYAATVLVLVHVHAHWPSLVAFWRGRTGRRSRTESAAPPPVPDGQPAPDAAPAVRPGLSRRAVIAAAGLGATGFAGGWLIRPPDVGRLPGEDFGALYHRASSPGFADALGALVNWGARPTQTKVYPAAAGVRRHLVPERDRLVPLDCEERRRIGRPRVPDPVDRRGAGAVAWRPGPPELRLTAWRR